MTNLNITERRKNTVLILDLDGKIKLGEDCAHLRQTLRLLAENGEKKILLNLANVSYIDSSGLGELVAGYITFQKKGGEVRLVNLSEGIHELMVITKLLTVFEIYDDETKGIESFDNPSFKATSMGNLI
jgi:anti-sigma B factor antagonist